MTDSADSFFKAILAYRNTPRGDLSNSSPAQIFLGRSLAGKFLLSRQSFSPWAAVRSSKLQHRTRVKQYFDRGTRTVPSFTTGTPVWVQQPNRSKRKGVVLRPASSNPQAYIVCMDTGHLSICNHIYLFPVVLPSTEPWLPPPDHLVDSELAPAGHTPGMPDRRSMSPVGGPPIVGSSPIAHNASSPCHAGPRPPILPPRKPACPYILPSQRGRLPVTTSAWGRPRFPPLRLNL